MLSSLTECFPRRATSWQLRTRELTFGKVPLVMGIVNVTPDSFSDGGQFLEPQQAIDHAFQLIAEGADILDIGGESTRPYATPVGLEEELQRIMPVIEALSNESIPLSIDTSKSEVAKSALASGVEIINDVSGLAGDPEMIPLAVSSGAGVCTMHMQGTPQTMQDDPCYEDVVIDIKNYLNARFHHLTKSGLEPKRICLDPGIGFGKTHQHNLTLMANCWQFHDLGRPLLVGHSRKGFLAKIIGDAARDRTAASIGSALSLALQGVQIIRVHDVRSTKDALLAFAATGGIDGQPLELAV